MIREALFGLAVGDALGVPVEFKSRQAIRLNPVTTMIGYGTYDLPPGTWSDDSSLAFCLAEALTGEFDLRNVADNFQKWLYENFWTPYGEVFDVGITTRQAIAKLAKGVDPESAGGYGEDENGNGSLMRILPLLFHIKEFSIQERYEITKRVSATTHRHIRSVIACFYYLEFARQLLFDSNKFAIHKYLQSRIPKYLQSISVDSAEIGHFNRLFLGNIQDLPEEEIQSSGYVIHTLEASIWCILTTDTYKDAVLKAVNLGSDTDTTGAVTGGLAGLLYGFDNIPTDWVEKLARKRDIDDLVNRMSNKIILKQ